MRNLYIYIHIIVLLFAVPVFAQLNLGKNTISIDGRSVDVYLPSDFSPDKRYPILFGLHHFDGKKKSTQDDSEESFVTQQQIISIYPEGKSIIFVGKKAWNTWEETDLWLQKTDDVAFITNVYNKVKSELGPAFNTQKVMAYGFSNGGAMAMEMVKKTGLFKGIAVRSMALVENENIPETAAKVPMIFVHGTADDTVPYNGGRGKKFFYSPSFDAIKNTVSKWARHNGITAQPMDIQYLAAGKIRDFWFREYKDATAPVYFYALPNAPHDTDGGFAHRNIKKTLIRMMKSPACYGLSQNAEQCKIKK